MTSELLSNYRDPPPVLEKYVEMFMQAELTWLDRRYPRYRSPEFELTATHSTKPEVSRNAGEVDREPHAARMAVGASIKVAASPCC